MQQSSATVSHNTTGSIPVFSHGVVETAVSLRVVEECVKTALKTRYECICAFAYMCTYSWYEC